MSDHISVHLIEPDPVERSWIMRALAGHTREIIAFDSGREYLAQPHEPVKPGEITPPPHEPGKPIPGEAKPGSQEGRNK